jgi:uncharacterized protein YkwD
VTFPRRLAAVTAALVVAMTASVVSAVSLGGAADVDSTAWRVDPPPYLRVSADERAARELVSLVNRARVEAGVDPVAWNSTVARASRAHAAYMESTGVTSHEGPPGITASQRLDAVGFVWTTWGETIGSGFVEPRPLVDAWMKSSTHRQSLIDPLFEHVGAGVVASPDGTPFWSLLLVATAPVPIP